MADQIIQWAASLGGEIEIAALGIASQEALAFEDAADAFGHAHHERLQLLLTWGLGEPDQVEAASGLEEIGGERGILSLPARSARRERALVHALLDLYPKHPL